MPRSRRLCSPAWRAGARGFTNFCFPRPWRRRSPLRWAAAWRWRLRILAGLGAAQHGLIPFAFASSLSAVVGYAGGRAMSRIVPREQHLPTGRDRGGSPAPGPGAPERQGAIARNHPGRAPRSCAGRDQAFQIHRHDRHRQKHRNSGDSCTRHSLRGDRAVIADPDGGYLQRFYDPASRGDVILNPFDQRSVKWNLFAEIRSATTSSSSRAPSFRITRARSAAGAAMPAPFFARSPGKCTTPA